MSRKKLNKKQLTWDHAISDARNRIRELETVIAACEEKKAKGEPWPESLAVTDEGKINTSQQQ